MQTRSALESAGASQRRDATFTARLFSSVSGVCGRDCRSDKQTQKEAKTRSDEQSSEYTDNCIGE